MVVARDLRRDRQQRPPAQGYCRLGQDAVADVFDALITSRQYRGAWPVEDAISWIVERAGRDFDPDVVDAFVHVIRRFQTDDPGWFPKAGGGHGMLGGAIGRKLRALFGRRAEAM